jgi:hypothetical protein
VDNVPVWLPLPPSLELEREDFRCCKRLSLFLNLPESAAECLDNIGSLSNGVWKIETGRGEKLKLDDRRGDVHQAETASIRSY